MGLGPPPRRDRRGLEAARPRGPVASIGIDTWGVDYGLLDAAGELVEPPVSYRDVRTAGYREVVERIGERRLYEITGLQLLPFNTIFQLAAHDPAAARPGPPRRHAPGARRGPPHRRGRRRAHERRTHRAARPRHRGLVRRVVDAVALAALLPEIRPPGTPVGSWRGVPVHLVGGHDTASAVLGGGRRGAAFVSAGTWLLVGREQPAPDTSEAARLAGFTNEQGAAGGIRLLRNVAGWWLVEECRRAWGDPDLDELLADAAASAPGPPSTPPTSASSRRPTWTPSCGRSRTRRRRRRGRRSSAAPSSRWPSRRRPSSRQLGLPSGAGVRRRRAVGAVSRRASPSTSTCRHGRPGRGDGARQRAGPGSRSRCLRLGRRGPADAGRPAGRASDEAPAEERPQRPAWPGNAVSTEPRQHGPAGADPPPPRHRRPRPRRAARRRARRQRDDDPA